MSPVRGVLGVLLATGALAACSPLKELRLPEPVSPVNGAPFPKGLLAGFGRRDITPPPGTGLNAYATESRQAVGFRQRLKARAIVLRDNQGEGLALVVVDLGMATTLVQRLVAERLQRAGSWIGADRLLLSATHTHSGPGNFFEAPGLNENAGRFPHLDWVMVDFLVERIAAAVLDAADDMRPAVAGWYQAAFWDFTLNRSFDAFLNNPSTRVPVTFGGLRRPGFQAVDSTFSMLRIDRCDRNWNRCRPKGAYATFAMHPTGIPQSNNLFDSDIHGVVADRVERELTRLNGTGEAGLFLLANSAQGDVGPAMRSDEPCRFIRLLPDHLAAGPATLPPPEAWRTPQPETAECLDSVRRETDDLGRRFADKVISTYTGPRPRLRSGITVDRAFRSIDLRTYSGPYTICWPPRPGMSSLGGAERGYVRTWKHRPLGIDLGFEEGGAARRSTPVGCFGRKRTAPSFLVPEHSMPEVIQLGVYRIGHMVLAAIPFEATTEVGALIREEVLRRAPRTVRRSAVVGLANGYSLYVASPDEYDMQFYEGAQTIYGPQTGLMLAYELANLASSLGGVPTVDVGPARAYYRPSRTHFWSPRPLDPRSDRMAESPACSRSGLTFRWTDAAPGTLLPSESTLAVVEDGTGQLVAFDSDPTVQVRAIRPKQPGYEWEVRWVPPFVPTGTYRVRVPARFHFPDLLSASCTVR